MPESSITITKDAIVMGFASFCIEYLARKRNVPYHVVFDRLMRTDTFKESIVNHYDKIHVQIRNWQTQVREKNLLRDIMDSPLVQDLIMCGMIGCIAYEISRVLGIHPIYALIEFYQSKTCKRLHNKSTGLYYFSDKYIAEDFVMEKKGILKVMGPS